MTPDDPAQDRAPTPGEPTGGVAWDEATAARWFDAWWDGTLDLEEAARLEATLRQDPALRRRFQQEARLHHDLAHALHDDPNPEVIWQRIADTLSASRRLRIVNSVSDRLPRTPWWRRSLGRRLAVAAAILTAIGSGWLWQREETVPPGTHLAKAGMAFETPVQQTILKWAGEETRGVLAAGGEVQIDGKNRKQVRLVRGDLELSVAHQVPGDALAIQAGPATAQVVGTRLLVSHDPLRQLATLAVREGLVRWFDARDQVLVQAGVKASADARGLWLRYGNQPLPGAEMILDEPLPMGANLLVGDAERLPNVRRICVKNVGIVEDTGGPWPAAWTAQSWQVGSRGEIAIAPHPMDGTPSFQLRNLSGIPSVQLNMPIWVNLKANTAYRFAFRYRSDGQSRPSFHIALDDRWWNDSPIPMAEGRWRTVAMDLPVAATTRTFRVTICNHDGTPADRLSVSAIRLVEMPLIPGAVVPLPAPVPTPFLGKRP